MINCPHKLANFIFLHLKSRGSLSYFILPLIWSLRTCETRNLKLPKEIPLWACGHLTTGQDISEEKRALLPAWMSVNLAAGTHMNYHLRIWRASVLLRIPIPLLSCQILCFYPSVIIQNFDLLLKLTFFCNVRWGLLFDPALRNLWILHWN